MATIVVTPASSPSTFSMCETNSGPTITTDARASPMICAISGGANRQFTDTLTAPSFAVAKVTSNHSGLFLSMNATRSSAPTPAAASAAATWFERRSSSPKVTVRSPTSSAGRSGRSRPWVRTISAMVLSVMGGDPPASARCLLAGGQVGICVCVTHLSGSECHDHLHRRVLDRRMGRGDLRRARSRPEAHGGQGRAAADRRHHGHRRGPLAHVLRPRRHRTVRGPPAHHRLDRRPRGHGRARERWPLRRRGGHGGVDDRARLGHRRPRRDHRHGGFRAPMGGTPSFTLECRFE